MNCDIFLNRYLSLDKNEPLPAGFKVHLLCCKSCRKTVNRLAAAENVQRQILDTPIDAGDRLLNATMNAIYRLNKQAAPAAVLPKENNSLLPWIVAGAFLMLGFILLPFSGIGKIDLMQFDDSFWISFALLCACSVIAYFSVFLAKNLVFFTEKFTRQV